jgi:transposase-like protein
MGNISNYCPSCGSQKVYVVEVEFEGNISYVFEHENNVLWYECGDCHSEWEAHKHLCSTLVGTHDFE